MGHTAIEFDEILQFFGKDKQTIKCIEELSELQKELCKQMLGKGDRLHLVEEIADCLIMLSQMQLAYAFQGEVASVIQQKYDRTMDYIKTLKEEIKNA